MKMQFKLLFLMLLALSWPVSSTEPINLGSGRSDDVVNLEAGARQPVQIYSFGRTGFVTPSMPQSMALSSSTILNDAQELIDEAQAARDEAVVARDEALLARDETLLARDGARSVYEQAEALFSRIEDTKKVVDDLAKSAQASSDACAMNADKCSNILNLTNETYNKNLALSSDFERNMTEFREYLLEARS